ncbi:MAG: zinc-binding alcohol dehydrogenase family protein [Methyloversatilis sp.]|jgi:zinc-binding alcohol dehydrogenase family protein|uniref:Zinc-type alcohol dehydrogenase-like protein n=1 Tax=Methyloversatilis universalis (strain ATCC BAA-1314 / DSM 25237 / JCM 13912 / CCUG 52030 / FAM5) TaxID=1000565 RepID=F5RDY7_METUF|nr:zinc-binding alcohol dehydrogenase family protein [Methyloversatilis universalis]EGK71118.1 Alcohol dehydrogenase, zinc-binding domain protein [Methyloversatilis universalis FAM5]MCP4638646.1 zinc-binding alcohol dehydrogenase family protein [Methyloversatilis sp.]
MKAVAFRQNLPVEHPDSLVDIDLPRPEARGHDLLVRIEAVAVNPVDTKVRRFHAPPADGSWRVPGWDAAGVVEAVGDQVSRFRPGDRVWYAGDLTRQGSHAEYQAVDERLVGRMPESLDFAEAAALPLTAITAWELLFDRLQLRDADGRLLIVGAAGGVGSIMIQLARALSRVTVIGTASRPDTAEWVRELGAHHVIDHRRPLAEALREAGIESVTHAASLTHTDQHYAQIVEALAPQGRLGLIDDPAHPLDVLALKRKSLSLHWELMFTRSLYRTDDMAEQGRLLDQVADLVDAGRLRSTLGEHYGIINAANLKRAHALLESGRARGKIVLQGF